MLNNHLPDYAIAALRVLSPYVLFVFLLLLNVIDGLCCSEPGIFPPLLDRGAHFEPECRLGGREIDHERGPENAGRNSRIALTMNAMFASPTSPPLARFVCGL